ncbi:TRAP transporter substrate-binding protein [Ponticoccus sp. SC2-23]|uniref:TRAP transporter substrate-binding protein n=1 Tax=Alexandriicola marinus TaxID=2081710 RepID=UPI000FD90EBE|nr:TRAP transporter substrate-binding protein [Alexandriicola marinus]MBM1219155.1 TRAP transporter substrate-binding protein [Ponticoccus sp. SC6-9]MBM1223773.1 TRAP transporter substrate-binding protein [Ponticoccus sp. SC6-15]MBM1228969.1 TRAP transporter substrate-binding protein [Ponticoccus sp. SC6-38]MBM1232739.1 TRAP transporter substrate-binding protein [Ponticoccus sp. SC6-45]MBM1237311.1 TRAP transporter substrate-binding protein [Ponticoccus sp. SC6-49]MBM1241750.1 TRAP transporte
MDRRSFLRASTAGAGAAAATALAAPAYAQGNRTLTMVTSVPDGFAIFDDAASLAASMITEMTDGQITINKMPAGSLVGAFEVFDAVSSGQADMYHSAEYYFLNQHPAFAYFTAVPFGMTGVEMLSWYYHKGGMELHQELASLFNLKPFLAGNTAMQPGGWFNKEITSAEDLQGLRFRMPGQGGQVLGRLGASVQNIPGGEIYQALASGQIDGAEWIGPFADERLGFQEVTNIYYTAGFHEPGSALALSMNLDVFESLTPAQQRIVEVACEATHANNLGLSWAENGAALARLQSEGVQAREFPDDVWEAFGRAAAEVREENMGDEIYANIANSYFAAMQETAAWWEIGDGEYIRQRNRVNAG